jgi:hypothetical protein
VVRVCRVRVPGAEEAPIFEQLYAWIVRPDFEFNDIEVLIDGSTLICVKTTEGNIRFLTCDLESSRITYRDVAAPIEASRTVVRASQVTTLNTHRTWNTAPWQCSMANIDWR